MRRLVVLVMLLALMTLLQTLQVGSDTPFNPLSLATFGFVLLGAYTLGQVAANIQLPKITGYIVTGLLFGPQILNIFSSAVASDLRVVNDLAIGLIALSAGAEMQLSGLKRIARSLLWIVVIKGSLILLSVTAAVFALASFIPFLAGQPTGLVLSVGMILGVLAMGTSPAATIAVISETGAKGRLADTTLGVAVAKDLVMVVLLAVALALARTFSPDGHGFAFGLFGEVALDLGLSLLAGGILGGLIIVYMRYVGAELWLFVVGIIFAMTAIAHEFHLEALLVFIVAGFVVRNGSSLGHGFLHLVETVALPVYVVFFSVAGAGLDLAALQSVFLVAVALVVVRLAAIFLGTAAATRLAGEPEGIRQNAWLSFVSQAGVVIGLSILVESNLPGIGTEIRTLVLATVAIYLLLGPVLFKLALTRVGEVRGGELEDELPGTVEVTAGELPVGPIPEELAEPVAILEKQVLAAVEDLAEAAAGPLRIAAELRGWPDTDPARNERTLSEDWSHAFEVAVRRFWSEVHRVTLAVPRQFSVPLEKSWFAKKRWETARERWMKRLRRLRRALKRLSGGEPVLYRTVPIRALALYHIDNAMVEALRPVLTRIAAQPALTLRDGLRAQRPPAVEPDENEADRELIDGGALEALAAVVQANFGTMRRELTQLGTAELPARRRRPSALHEPARRVRARTAKAIHAWRELAIAVAGHEQRRVAVEELRAALAVDAEAFRAELKEQFDDIVVQPIDRARDVVQKTLDGVGALHGAESGAVEAALIETSEAVSVDLRRDALAGLRRSVETRPLDRLIKGFDDQIEDRLEALAEGFLVVDPDDLPDPALPARALPQPADHEFRLIATGAVERTLRPTVAKLRERSEEALEEAARCVQDVREMLELRFDAAVDAAIEERRSARNGGSGVELRGSLQIEIGALKSALSTLDGTRQQLDSFREEALGVFQADFDALIERIGTQLASARPLGARLHAERARVQLHGTAFLRLLVRRIRARVRHVLERLGLRTEAQRERRREARGRWDPLEPAGRAGSDRAVIFHIMFEHTSLAGKIFDGCLILTILGSIAVLMLESVEPIRLQHGTALEVLEWMFTLLFTLEYVARLWVVDRPLRYAFSFFGIIDFLAVIPTYLGLFVPSGQYLMVIRVLRVARAFRVLKLTRYVGEAQVLIDALRASRYKITVFLVYVVIVAVVVGSAMYLIEGPESGFTSIPRSMYWSIVTLTTVGFGDITPQSPAGQALAAILMILGYGIIAVPTGIVTAEIASQPRPSPLVQTCPKCGRKEEEPAAVYCLVCGANLSGESYVQDLTSFDSG